MPAAVANPATSANVETPTLIPVSSDPSPTNNPPVMTPTITLGDPVSPCALVATPAVVA